MQENPFSIESKKPQVCLCLFLLRPEANSRQRRPSAVPGSCSAWGRTVSPDTRTYKLQVKKKTDVSSSKKKKLKLLLKMLVHYCAVT